MRFWHVFSQYRMYRLYRNIVKAQSLLKQYNDYLKGAEAISACAVSIDSIDPENVDWSVCKKYIG